MPLKSAQEKLKDTEAFLMNAKKAIAQLEEVKRRLESDATFRKLWDTDSAEALRQVGIDPEARHEMGLGPYEEGAQCKWCVTPQGNACHC